MTNGKDAFGRWLRGKRERAGLSQTALAGLARWPQSTVSRVEQGKRSVTLPELENLARVFGCSVVELLAEAGRGTAESTRLEQPALSAGFGAAYRDEGALLAHLACYGVRFLGADEPPALSVLPIEEVLLAALAFTRDARVFEALPALVLRHGDRIDWTKLASAAYALRLQNRLGMLLATALALKESARDVSPLLWRRLRAAHDALAEGRLDKEEFVGPAPKTAAAKEYLRRRTPSWLRPWHGVSSTELDSFKRHLTP